MPTSITNARADPLVLLDWYDRNHRSLPWRVPPADGKRGVRADPYRVWLSEVMLQQTTVAAVIGYFERFTARWPSVDALAQAPLDEVLAAWAGLGYYARARNLHKCACVVSQTHGGQFPDTQDGLRALPGIGTYTAAAIAAIAFGRKTTVVDGNVERVMARLHAEHAPLPGVKGLLAQHAAALTPDQRPGDYAQAVMDLGATICTPRNPACALCPWQESCAARALGVQTQLPAKTAKKAKPTRHGTVWIAMTEDGRALTCRRPDKGLLGGMLALPSSEWSVERLPAPPPLDANWTTIGEVRHTFTHFHLVLDVQLAVVPLANDPAWRPIIKAASAMPTVFRKACELVPISTG